MSKGLVRAPAQGKAPRDEGTRGQLGLDLGVGAGLEFGFKFGGWIQEQQAK